MNKHKKLAIVILLTVVSAAYVLKLVKSSRKDSRNVVRFLADKER